MLEMVGGMGDGGYGSDALTATLFMQFNYKALKFSLREHGRTRALEPTLHY